MTTFAVLAVLFLGWALSGDDESKETKTPDQEKALLVDLPGGYKGYKPEVRAMFVDTLANRAIRESGHDNSAWLDDHEGRVSAGQNAYLAAYKLHELGHNIWITPTLLDPTPQSRLLYWTTKESPNPPKDANLALLVSFADQWPGTIETD